jgi:hypothetical protein
VIAPNLALELGLSPVEIGLSSVFLRLCGCQIPVGVALDRFGPGFVFWSARRSRWWAAVFAAAEIRAS